MTLILIQFILDHFFFLNALTRIQSLEEICLRVSYNFPAHSFAQIPAIEPTSQITHKDTFAPILNTNHNIKTNEQR